MRFAGLFAAIVLVAAAVGAPSRVAADVSSPIKTLGCEITSTTDGAENIAAISFENLAAQPVVAVKFGVYIRDAFGKVLGVPDVGVVYGSFAPNVVIEPHKNLGGYYKLNADDPGSSAIGFYNVWGTQAASVYCQPLAAKFADGSVWSLPGT